MGGQVPNGSATVILVVRSCNIMSKVTLDRETFKALASETRLHILHALDERRKTGSELARELELNKATVHEHLQTLVAAGLVSKKDEGRKWVYWELSWEGSKLLHPGQGAVFSVLLGLGILSSGGGIFALGSSLSWWRDTLGPSDESSGTALAPEADENRDTAADGADEEAGGNGDSTAAQEAPQDEALGGAEPSLEADTGGGDGLTIAAIMLLLTAIVAIASAIWLRRRR